MELTTRNLVMRFHNYIAWDVSVLTLYEVKSLLVALHDVGLHEPVSYICSC